MAERFAWHAVAHSFHRGVDEGAFHFDNSVLIFLSFPSGATSLSLSASGLDFFAFLSWSLQLHALPDKVDTMRVLKVELQMEDRLKGFGAGRLWVGTPRGFTVI